MILHTGANEQAGIPQWAENMICTIFDKGITFWTDGDQVGNYNRLNPILS